MSNSVPTPANQADPILTEHAVEIRRLHNRLTFLARRIQVAHERANKGETEWIEGSLELAVALREGREAVPADTSFKEWLKINNLDFYNYSDRAALIALASNVDLARTVLTESKSRSYQLIWRDHKHRFHTNMKPTPTSRVASEPKRARGKEIHRDTTGMADLHRREKLGDATVDKIQGTSLDSAEEIDELVNLNRGSPEGEHTPIVKQLVDDAVAGKLVSAIAKGRGTAPKLIAAFYKRMVAPWALATKQERDEFIEHLISISNER